VVSNRCTSSKCSHRLSQIFGGIFVSWAGIAGSHEAVRVTTQSTRYRLISEYIFSVQRAWVCSAQNTMEIKTGFDPAHTTYSLRKLSGLQLSIWLSPINRLNGYETFLASLGDPSGADRRTTRAPSTLRVTTDDNMREGALVQPVHRPDAGWNTPVARGISFCVVFSRHQMPCWSTSRALKRQLGICVCPLQRDHTQIHTCFVVNSLLCSPREIRDTKIFGPHTCHEFSIFHNREPRGAAPLYVAVVSCLHSSFQCTLGLL
jgi:hypothetical protein